MAVDLQVRKGDRGMFTSIASLGPDAFTDTMVGGRCAGTWQRMSTTTCDDAGRLSCCSQHRIVEHSGHKKNNLPTDLSKSV